MWSLFATDMKFALEDHANARLCKSSTYLNCHFRVKWIYKTYVSNVQPFKGQVPEYPGWFEPFVMQWLNENDDVSLEFLHSAYARDKKDKVLYDIFFLDKFCYILNSMIPIKKLKNSASSNNNKMIPSFYIQNIFCRAQCLTFFSPLAYSILTHCMSPRAYLIEKKLKNSSLLFFLQFQKNTEHSNFSNSVVDVFTQLTQCFEVLQKLECQDPEIWKRYMKRFAKTVVKVITAYSDLLKNDFPNHVKDEPTVIIYNLII